MRIASRRGKYVRTGSAPNPKASTSSPSRSRHERVRLPASEVDQAVARANLVGRVRLSHPLHESPDPRRT